ncbi:putative zinc-binding metallopeptidase [bacterium]|nr:putative zinc-binding metallopeptidase [bacterium]
MGSRAKPTKAYSWEKLSDEDLLRLRLCDLDLKFKGSTIEPLIEKLLRELRNRGLLFTPHFWYSAEWFTPDGIPGIAVPFYLAHPRLMELDRNLMKGTLPETPDFSLRVLRHEAGHAIENAFRLRSLPEVQAVFGRSSQRYPRYYSPMPYSRRFVTNLGQGYAQSHPDEDFAETFAIWLTPRSEWREKYAGWPALRKLEFMDWLMKAIAGKEPLVRNARTIDALPRLRLQLRTHYRRQRRHFMLDVPEVDRRLRALFRESDAPRASMTADAFLRRIKPKLSRQVSELSGEPKYRVDRVVDEMIFRSRNLKLRVSPSRLPLKGGVPPALTNNAIRFLRAGLYRIAI